MCADEHIQEITYVPIVSHKVSSFHITNTMHNKRNQLERRFIDSSLFQKWELHWLGLMSMSNMFASTNLATAHVQNSVDSHMERKIYKHLPHPYHLFDMLISSITDVLQMVASAPLVVDVVSSVGKTL